MLMERCGHCRTLKGILEFPPSRKTNRGQWCRACYRERMRGVLGLEASEREVECQWCGHAFDTTYAKALYCSKPCKDRAKARTRQAGIDAAKPDRRCLWCGIELPRTMRSDARFCSVTCNDRAHSQTRNYRRRMGKDAPRKPRKEPLLNFAEIAERDRWRCGICGGAVSRDRTWPDVLAASLDHILPVSREGTNDPENVRLSHLRCNASRRAG